MTLLDNIPAELRAMRRWICWRYETRRGKRTKPPWSPVTDKYASSVDPATWCDYEAANAFLGASQTVGLGFVFVATDGIVGIDLDKAIDNNNVIQPWAQEIVDAFDTYTEKSPSGTGLHLFVRGTMPDNAGRKVECESGAIEMYNTGRYFTMTGETINAGVELVSHQAGLDWLYERYFKADEPTLLVEEPPQTLPTVECDADDAAIIKQIRRSFKWRDVFDGHWRKHYTSQSQADLGLAGEIQRLVGPDSDRIDRIFRMSKLVRPKYERPDYRNRTINKAISNPRKSKAKNNGHDNGNGNGHIPPPPPRIRPEFKPSRTIEDDCDDVESLIDATIDGSRCNIPWMWPSLTHAGRCLLPGTITVLCGGAGSAKSMFMSHAMIDWMAQDLPFAVYHLEEDKAFHLVRAQAQLCGDSRVTLDDWVRDNPDEIRRLWQQTKEPIGQLAGKITDAPQSTITLPDLLDWQRDRLKDGCRIVIIDPVTAADPGGDQWTADRDFVNDSKRLMREYKASLIVVTHPRGGKSIGDKLDQIAGGRAYNRFTSSVLWLDAVEPEIMKVRNGLGESTGIVNRVIQVWKARSGPGSGWHIGFYFDPKTLRFKEQGVIVKEKKK